MICSWCRVEYNDTPLYHVCKDGSTFDVRAAKNQAEIEAEHARQDTLANKSPDILDLTARDKRLLEGMKISIK